MCREILVQVRMWRKPDRVLLVQAKLEFEHKLPGAQCASGFEQMVDLAACKTGHARVSEHNVHAALAYGTVNYCTSPRCGTDICGLYLRLDFLVDSYRSCLRISPRFSPYTFL